MFDLGLTLTRQAIRRQLAAMPCELYLVRLIHNLTKRPFPGERLWTSTQLANLATVRFLRVGSQSFLRLRLGTLVSAVAFSAAHLLAQQIEHLFHKQPESAVRRFLQQPRHRPRERGPVGILHRLHITVPVVHLMLGFDEGSTT